MKRNIKYIICLIGIIILQICIVIQCKHTEGFEDNKEDFAIIYFGLTRSLNKVYQNHIDRIYKVLDNNNVTYKKFMHTWDVNPASDDNNKLNNKPLPEDYILRNLESYRIDNEDDFRKTINMDDYFYQDILDKFGENTDGEWVPKHLKNHLCMLESQKRGLEMVENYMSSGKSFKYIMYIRPDLMFEKDLPINDIMRDNIRIHVTNRDHYEGINDQFAIMNYEQAQKYGKRINEIAEFRKNNGRIVSEKYCKFIINKYNMKVNEMDFPFKLIRM